ncbi:hypothetical protein P5673_029139 [Acropora cervicornis]|uniref:Uncharacterized protein n=1 Tax=Acropora cervicornis TaxID=6130 RepID=A0AAD9UUC3_ACRCE|nr:hypothetical protein P5673_029139 [Acropora cervicornis]
MQWVSREGEPSLEKMTSEDTCLTHVHGIVAGETPNVRDLSFRDPDCFQSGQLRTRISPWEKILDGYELAKDVLEWLEHGVDVKNSLSPLRDHLWVSSMRARNPRLEFLRTTILANSFRSLLRKQFCNVSSQERSVFGVKWVKWHRPMPPRPSHDDRTRKAEVMH